jgi:hypothetical protein
VHEHHHSHHSRDKGEPRAMAPDPGRRQGAGVRLAALAQWCLEVYPAAISVFHHQPLGPERTLQKVSSISAS